MISGYCKVVMKGLWLVSDSIATALHTALSCTIHLALHYAPLWYTQHCTTPVCAYTNQQTYRNNITLHLYVLSFVYCIFSFFCIVLLSFTMFYYLKLSNNYKQVFDSKHLQNLIQSIFANEGACTALNNYYIGRNHFAKLNKRSY